MAHLHVIAGSDTSIDLPIRNITFADVKDALAKGYDDFSAMPSHAIFLCLIYPLVGLFLGGLLLGFEVLPLFFPLAAGFALIGPFAAIGLYELSRRREAGLDSSWKHAFDVFRSPSFGAIAGLGVLLTIIFLAWIAIAQTLYQSLFGVLPPSSLVQFARDIVTTDAGWKLMIIGNGIGFVFAVIVLAISAISFPLLLDRDVGAAIAIVTSVRVALANPATMALWGLIVAVGLLLGSVPFFIPLAVIMPVLGHATWHLYRKAVVS